MKILTNSGRVKHGDVICELLKGAAEVWMFVAYLGETSTQEIENALKAACRRHLRINVYCGLNQYVSHPDAIQRLFEMFRKAKNARLYLWDQRNKIFHPKVYCFFSKSNLTMVIGSANLTGGGMQNNVELSAIQTVPQTSPAARAIRTFRLEIRGVVKLADPRAIEDYRRRYRIYRSRVKEAERAAERDVKKLCQLDLEKVRLYLRRYRNAGKPEKFKERLRNYEKARKVLIGLAEGRNVGKSLFRERYESLVNGNERLWTSSGLYRTKEAVIRCYLDVISLIREIRANLRESPETVFEIGKRRIKDIGGFGVNHLTEVMQTFRPDRFALLNKKSLKALEDLGCPGFPVSNSFKPETYAEFNEVIAEVMTECGFDSAAQTDQFLAFVRKRRSNYRLFSKRDLWL